MILFVIISLFLVITNVTGLELCSHDLATENSRIVLYNDNVQCIRSCEMSRSPLEGATTLYFIPDYNFENLHLTVKKKEREEMMPTISFDIEKNRLDLKYDDWNYITFRILEEVGNDINYNVKINNAGLSNFYTGPDSFISYNLTGGKVWFKDGNREINAEREKPGLPRSFIEYNRKSKSNKNKLEECNSNFIDYDVQTTPINPEDVEPSLKPEVEDVALFIQQYWWLLLAGAGILIVIFACIFIGCKVKSWSNKRELHRVLSYSDAPCLDALPNFEGGDYAKVQVQMDPPCLIVADQKLTESKNDNAVSDSRGSWVYTPNNSGPR